ncbi:hypothetical protein SS1G_01545 [Sclerotinia sclerotiorum 1980 UF-70]|uniref:GST N-terminal domain-containing protein n=1 Tax=Sclerotinia sclerotiorum (strain ATCC 18683 / 1980 / Ss-1) TaxID=665079 RepID=A7E8B7_SCLS1|nr:hypothetical protein SS1G_01545 [Sclerotinia sclerotiorum 1980 UF-70]EDN96619.1 hypothetical protein SS1G_01545 [Sclerotinia sclerotiorum 1980 UF-70]
MTNSHPDADLFPHATGFAAQMVEEHSKEEPVKLYAGWFCPFVQRVLLILLEKNIPFQYIEVNPYHKPASLLKLNPRAPWALRIWVFDYFKGGLHIEELGDMRDRWEKWVDAIEERKSIQMSLSETKYYLPIYQRRGYEIISDLRGSLSRSLKNK